MQPISKIAHDGKLDLATGRHRRESNWKNKQWLWSDLLKKLSVTHRTAETHAEYLASKKPRQDEIKDIGGFVGGYLDKGRRKSGSVVHRQLITLDLDYAKPGMWDDFTLMYGNAGCIYSTHKHSPESPRLRLIMPLDREVKPDEYVAIARRLAGNIGIEDFDPTGFRPSQLMYWPSTPKDGEYVFEYQDGPWLKADDILASYHNWADASEWPMSEREKAIPLRAIKKQGDPLEKHGVVGAFCRTYSISAAIETFLSDAYEPCDIEDRYTYKEGSTAAGLVVYEDKYAFSHHGTDPVSGKLCNAFDLVRLHKFGLRDEDVRDGTPGNKLPSYTEMVSFAAKDKVVSKLIGLERLEGARSDFSDEFEEIEERLGEPVNDDWLGDLERDKKSGIALNTINNVVLIFRNDPLLKGRICYNQFENREVALKDLPWRKVKNGTRHLTDADDAGLRHYLEKWYGITSGPKIKDGLDIVVRENQFHPIQDFIKSATWDGTERLDELLITYLGADDNLYVRTITRKALVAAVARVFEPGIKFDNMLIIVGEQGIGKSTLISKLGQQWFSDSFNFHMLTNKQAEEQLQGAWLIEVGELTGMNKADLESAKSFLSRCEDRYRIAYGKRLEYFPRQSVFFGSTNNPRPLRDSSGNRRFWPSTTSENKATKSVFTDLDIDEVKQIWAEAYQLYKQGESLYLSDEVKAMAEAIQAGHTEVDDRVGLIQGYLDTLLPENWDDLEVYARRDWVRGDELQPAGTVKRGQVCAAEIWCEVLGGSVKDMNRANTKFIHDIMQQIKGWEMAKSNRKFSLYGLQRAYLRTVSVYQEAFLQ